MGLFKYVCFVAVIIALVFAEFNVYGEKDTTITEGHTGSDYLATEDPDETSRQTGEQVSSSTPKPSQNDFMSSTETCNKKDTTNSEEKTSLDNEGDKLSSPTPEKESSSKTSDFSQNPNEDQSKSVFAISLYVTLLVLVIIIIGILIKCFHPLRRKLRYYIGESYSTNEVASSEWSLENFREAKVVTHDEDLDEMLFNRSLPRPMTPNDSSGDEPNYPIRRVSI